MDMVWGKQTAGYIEHPFFREGITLSQMKVYAILVAYNRNGSWTVFPAIDTIAQLAGISRATVKRAMRALEGQGLIEKTEVEGRVNRYRLIQLPAQFDLLDRMLANDADCPPESVPGSSRVTPLQAPPGGGTQVIQDDPGGRSSRVTRGEVIQDDPRRRELRRKEKETREGRTRAGVRAAGPDLPECRRLLEEAGVEDPTLSALVGAEGMSVSVVIGAVEHCRILGKGPGAVVIEVRKRLAKKNSEFLREKSAERIRKATADHIQAEQDREESIRREAEQTRAWFEALPKQSQAELRERVRSQLPGRPEVDPSSRVFLALARKLAGNST